MRLTDAENRLVAKLRKGQRVWRSSRWVVLGVCVAGAVQTVSALFSLTDLGPEQLNLTKLAFIACFSPPVWVFLSVCSVGIGYTIGRWKGDAKTNRVTNSHRA